MRTLINLSFLVLALVSFTSAQASLAESIASLPSCALSCLAAAVADSPCTLTNQTCICTNAQLQASVDGCVRQSCTIKEGLTTKNTTMSTCGVPSRSRVSSGRIIGIVLGSLSALIVALRVGYKLLGSRTDIGWDDYFIVITFVMGLPNTIIIDRVAYTHGLGLDIWTVPFHTITDFAKTFYIMEIMYFFDLALLKMSLLFFYERIFPAKNVKRMIWATLAFNCAFGVVFGIVAIFQCWPINHSWKYWDGEHKGRCISANRMAWANAGISIVLDIWMLAIPISQLIHLKLAWRKKVGVAMMFFVGTFVTIVSILRLQSLVSFATSLNPTWDQVPVTNWSTIELNVGIMCACMPAMRVILVRLHPKILGSSYNSTTPKYGKNRSQDPVSTLSNRTGRDRNGPGSNGIKYTKTFEVQHGDDEEELVPMDDLGTKGTVLSARPSNEFGSRGKVISTRTSEISL